MDEEKKGERKRKRFAARLKSSKGIICTEVHGQNIVLCNVGQATGLEKDTIIQLLEEYNVDIPIPKLISEKGESHSFLVFSRTEDATLFFNSCNGKAKLDRNGPPLFMSFVEHVPNLETICEHSYPDGLTILTNFVSEDEEQFFISLFDWNDESNLKNRQVKHYGYEFRYGSNDVDLSNPMSEKIPEQCDVLWKRLRKKGCDLGVPDQMTINKYAPGHGIPSHVDKHSPFGSTILSLSLGSSVVMDWKHHSGKHVPVVIPARSLMIMQGEARYDWQHGIQPRTWDPIIETRTENSKLIKVITNETVQRQTRWSLTFRWTRSGPCECEYKTLCDSVEKASEEVNDDVAHNLEELHVHQVYEQIAGHFSKTRHKPWPKVIEFMEQVPSGSVLLDLGCGNGKNILNRNDIVQIAAERSSGLLKECWQHIREISGADCVRADLLQANFKDECADYIICIAVIHHFCSTIRRSQSISTIARLLRPGGKALITVWAKDQTKSNYLLKTKTPTLSQEVISVGGVNLHVHENRTQFQHNDLLVPWKLRSQCQQKLTNKTENTLLRYYHVFEENELNSLCQEIPSLVVEKTFLEEGNWCVVCSKRKAIK